ncbi:MAG TPA: ATP-binding protein [Patescibacteria group bacterium]|nr:ATP-binding protein [Patescibacteria group bacterium]
MQSVKERWYKLYSWVLVVTAAICLVLSTMALALTQFKDLQAHGFSTLALAISVTIILYRLLLFSRISNRFEKRVAVFGMSLITMLLSISFTNSTGQLHSWFHASWLVLILFGGMFGGYIILSFLVLTSMYMILIMTNVRGQLRVDVFSLGVLGLNFAVGAASYLIWRRMYINQESLQVARLSGALKSKEQQAEILIESLADGVIVTDPEGKISLVNQAAATLTGWSVEESVGIDVQLVAKFAEEDGKELSDDLNPFKQAFVTRKPVDIILRLMSRDGKTHHTVSLVVSPVILPKAEEPAGTAAIIRDISAAREEEHRRADFISTASHEMRTPVAAIEGYLALALNDKVSRIDSKARSYLEKAHESTQHLGKLFQDLLTSAKAEDGRLVNHPLVTEMGSYLEQLADTLRFAAEKKGLLLDFTIGTSEKSEGSISGGKVVRPLYYSYIDPDRMREVITNLFDNAVKYTESGKISVGLTGNNDIIQFYIRDTGHGIPPEDIPHLFQKFYRVDNSTTRTIGGTGLGLFICRKIVELYNGHIWVESEINKGSTFYINVPRLSSQEATELQKKVAQQPL